MTFMEPMSVSTICKLPSTHGASGCLMVFVVFQYVYTFSINHQILPESFPVSWLVAPHGGCFFLLNSPTIRPVDHGTCGSCLSNTTCAKNPLSTLTRCKRKHSKKQIEQQTLIADLLELKRLTKLSQSKNKFRLYFSCSICDPKEFKASSIVSQTSE